MWDVLGANRKQLSLLVAGQMTLMSLLVSFFGSLSSIFLSRYYYQVVQYLAGKTQLPDTPIRFSLWAFCLTLFIMAMISFFGGVIHTNRLLRKMMRQDESRFSPQKRWFHLVRYVGIFLLVLLWFYLTYIFFMPPSSLSGEELIFKLDNNILLVVILQTVLIYLATPELPKFLVKLSFRKTTHYGWTLAKWQVLTNDSYLKSLSSSVIVGITLISNFLMYSHVTYAYLDNASQQSNETNAVLLLFVAGPMLVILANLIAITILSSLQEEQTVQQWLILGVSKAQRLFIRVCEAGIYSIVVSFISVASNLIYLILTMRLANYMGIRVSDFTNVYAYSLIVSSIMFVFLIITQSCSDYRIDQKRQ